MKDIDFYYNKEKVKKMDKEEIMKALREVEELLAALEDGRFRRKEKEKEYLIKKLKEYKTVLQQNPQWLHFQAEEYANDIQGSRMEGYSSGLYGGGKRMKKSKRQKKSKKRKTSKRKSKTKRRYRSTKRK